MCAAAFVAHHLRLVGIDAVAAGEQANGAVYVYESEVASFPAKGRIGVLLQPIGAMTALDTTVTKSATLHTEFVAAGGANKAWERLSTFHSAAYFEGPGLIPVVCDADGGMVWAFCPDSLGGGVLLVGTNLAADLLLLRQGRPEAARNRPTEAQWGYAGERPNYLFAGQFDPGDPFNRPADWWLWTLRDALVRLGEVTALPILPGGVPGLVVVTGDDDQASIQDYRAQRVLLGDLPITYFLHPLAQLDAAGLAEIASGRTVEWELHPDALETPDDYPQRLADQAIWFEKLIGRKARLVRNHGFLNDGYWRHAASWLAHGIVGSSNIPGVDGQIVNGSLLPARLVLGGDLTPHWSLLTAFGDGAIFVHNWDAETTCSAVLEAGRRIVESGVPGVLVFNLHPANHLRARPMHEAVRQLTDNGFAAMTLGEALRWFGGQRGAAKA